MSLKHNAGAIWDRRSCLEKKTKTYTATRKIRSAGNTETGTSQNAESRKYIQHT